MSKEKLNKKKVESKKDNVVINETNKKGDIIKVVGVVIGVVALFTLVFFASTLRNGTDLKPNVIDTTVSEYFNLKQGTEDVVILFASPDCPWCVKYKPIINKVSSDYELPVYYVDTSKMTNDEYTSLVADSPYMTSKGGFGTPLTMIVGNNEEVSYVEGKIEYDDLVNFLKDNGIIE